MITPKIKIYLWILRLVVFLLFTSSATNLFSQPKKNYNDGPYIDIAGDFINIKWVEKGLPRDTTVHKINAFQFKVENLPEVDLTSLDIIDDDMWEYDNINKFIVISDLHGQFDTAMSLLKVHKIVDSVGNWIFEDHHLIVAGDHFSRGDKVMEILWFLFKLEKQALAAGGKVHVMLGNHDWMTLNNDLRYLNVKYVHTSGVFQTPYHKFFTGKSVLGCWLRKKNVIITINDQLIVHAGLSQKVVDANLSVQKINSLFRDSIMKNDVIPLVENERIELLVGDDGPLWYRAYADTLAYHEDSIQKILHFYNVNSVIVGHTIMPEITSRFGGKIFLIDCGLITGKSGEVLIWNDERFYRGKANGKKSALNKPSKKGKRSLFDFMYTMTDDNKNPKLKITTNLKNLIKNKLKEVEQESTFELINSKDSSLFSFLSTVRARGNMRKQVCYFPPVKFNFAKKDLSKYSLKSADKLKMVFPCRGGETAQEKLLLEYFLYTIYQIIDSNSVRAKLVDVQIINDKKVVDEQFTAIVVEDEDAYALRTNARVVESKAILNSTALEREPFVLMFFFQYMISNTDWSVGNRHNVLIAKLPQYQRVVALPYDFDYSGFVGQSYAVPDASLPIKSVHEKHFMPYVISQEEFDFAVKYYQSLKQAILEKCDNASYLKPSTIEANKRHILEFYEELDRPDRLIKNIKTKE